jgi:hypothetical protein
MVHDFAKTISRSRGIELPFLIRRHGRAGEYPMCATSTTRIIHAGDTARISLAGYDLLNNPRLNKGTAFTDEERDTFVLHGLLPPHVGALKDQLDRRTKAFDSLKTNFGRYSFMRDLKDTNETLFYSLIEQDVEKFLPVVYTPTVGEGCQRFSEIWRKPRGLFISYPNKDRIDQMLAILAMTEYVALL